MKLKSYWIDTAPPFSSAAQGPPQGGADVAVIGAGFTGLSAALALARKGAKVVVLEAGRVANAASGRNGGMCNNGFAQDYYGMSTKLGVERANALYRAFDAGVDKVEALIAEEGIDCHFKRVGKLKLAAKPEHYDKLVRAQALLAAQVDPDTRLVPRHEMRDRDRIRSLSWWIALRKKRWHACRQVRPGAGRSGGAPRRAHPRELPGRRPASRRRPGV